MGANHVTTALFQNSRQIMEVRKDFGVEEKKLYIKFGKNALRAFELYFINPIGTNVVENRERELKETIDHFSQTFIMLPLAGFTEVSESLMDFLVEKMHENNLLHTITHPILIRKTYSFAFSSILVKYIIKKMPEMGNPGKRSQLYLLLFKHLCGTLLQLKGENDEMLRPHLEAIVNGALDNAITSKDPESYFLLLRSLFRSISGGVHERLYQQFLPLLPRLLRQFNQLQAADHRPEMHDLFIELCLTVPVRLSYLLPHMERLMEPLVAALTGTQNLVSQGLRTLELFIDNLQQEFLHGKIVPVRAQLMRALWNIINRDDIIRKTKDKEQSAVAAFRILGKFGGENRSTIREPPKLKWKLFDTPGVSAKIMIDSTTSITLPFDQIIDVAFETIRHKSASMETRKFAAESLLNMFYTLILREDEEHMIEYRVIADFSQFKIIPELLQSYVKTIMGNHGKPNGKGNGHCPNFYFSRIIAGLLFVTGTQINQKTKREIVDALEIMITHFIIVGSVNLYQVMRTSKIEEIEKNKSKNSRLVSMVDGIVHVLNLNTANTADASETIISLLEHALKIGVRIMGSHERATQLPFFSIISQRLIENCYRRPWYSKLGAATVLNFMIDTMPLSWLETNDCVIFGAFMFVIRDLFDQVSFGAVDFAKECIRKLLKKLINESRLNPKIEKDLVKELISASTVVRRFCQEMIRFVSAEQNVSVQDFIKRYKKTFTELKEKSEKDKDILPITPPHGKMFHQSIPLQIGILDGVIFCLDLKPPLFVYDWENSKDIHIFLLDVFKIMEGNEKYLEQPCYR